METPHPPKPDLAGFDCAHAEAHFVDGLVVIEFETPAHIRMMLRFEPRLALNLAHQMEKAWHAGINPEDKIHG